MLFDMVPEYKDVFNKEELEHTFEFGGILFFNEFSTYLAEKVVENPNSEFVLNSIAFINELGNCNNPKHLNILEIGILEILYTSGIEAREYFEKNLSLDNRIIFDNLSRFYR